MGSTWVFTDLAYQGQRMPQAVVEWLHSQGLPTMLVIAGEPHRLSTSLPLEGRPPKGRPSVDPCTTEGALNGLEPGDAVIARGTSPAVRALLQAAQARGAACLEDPEALAAMDDPSRALTALEACGLWVPTTFFARSPEDLAGVAPELFPLALSPMEGPRAKRRIVRSLGELLALDWRPGGVVAQTRAASGQIRLLVAGNAVWAQRTGSWTGAHTRPNAMRVSNRHRALAEQCRAALNLELLSLDIADFGEGPMVVDVEAFPEYEGVRDAPAVIGHLLQWRAGRAAHEATYRTPHRGR